MNEDGINLETIPGPVTYTVKYSVSKHFYYYYHYYQMSEVWEDKNK